MIGLAILRAEHMTAEGNSICFTIAYPGDKFNLSGVHFRLQVRQKQIIEGMLQNGNLAGPFWFLSGHGLRDCFRPFAAVGTTPA